MQLKHKLFLLWPLLLFSLLLPLHSKLIIGSQPTWFPQTDFYFICLFILAVSLTVYNFITKVGGATGGGPNDAQSRKARSIVGTRERQNLLLLIIFIIAAFIFSYFALLRLFDISIEKPDFHAFITVFWNTAHGDLLRSTYLGGARSWFSLHIEPILFLFVPLYWLPVSSVWSSIFLQITQVIIGVSGIFPVFLLAQKKLNSKSLGIIAALTFLFLPALQFQLLYDFHIEIISLIAILWSIYFLETKRFKPFLLTLLLAISVREEFAIYTSLFGVYLLLKPTAESAGDLPGGGPAGFTLSDKRRRNGGTRAKQAPLALGIILLITGFSYFLLTKFFIIPLFGNGSIAPAQESMFSQLGTSPSAIMGTLTSKPLQILQFMFTERKIQYLILMIVSTGFLSLLSPLVLLTIPFFIMNLLLNFDLPSSIFWHYQSWLLPIFIWAAIDTIARRPEKTRFAFSAFFITACLLSSLFFGPINILGFDLGTTHKSISRLEKNIDVKTIAVVEKLIGKDASVSADAGLTPFFSSRRDFYLFPENMRTEYIVASLKLFNRYPHLHTALTKNGYCLKGVDGILVYKKHNKCDVGWRDKLVDTGQILPELKISEDSPVTPSKLNFPKIVTFTYTFPRNKPSKNMMYVVSTQMRAKSPSKVTIEAGLDSKNYQKIITCSALADTDCTDRIDITGFMNKKNKVYFRMYLFADKRITNDLKSVRVTRISLHTFTIKHGR